MNKVSIEEIGGNHIINSEGDFEDNLLQLGLLMTHFANKLTNKYSCSTEQSISFIQDLPNKLVYSENGDSLVLEVLKS